MSGFAYCWKETWKAIQFEIMHLPLFPLVKGEGTSRVPSPLPGKRWQTHYFGSKILHRNGSNKILMIQDE